MSIFSGRFPHEAFRLIAVLVRKSLHFDDPDAAEEESEDVGLSGVRAIATPADLSLTLLSIMSFWDIFTDNALPTDILTEMLVGLEQLLGTSLEANFRTIDYRRVVLELV